MVFNILFWCLIGIVSVWLVVLSWFLFRLMRHYNTLTGDVKSQNLVDLLEKIIEKENGTKKQLENIEKEIAAIDALNQTQISHIGINRFNPFSDTGGNQSFTIALLNEEDSGIVMTSLYARTGNRWYVKRVQKGEGSEVALSREEKAAIREAKRV